MRSRQNKIYRTICLKLTKYCAPQKQVLKYSFMSMIDFIILLMSNNKLEDLERDLLGSLLDQTQQSEKTPKKQTNIERVQAFSAPPMFFEFDFKIDYSPLDQYDFDSPDPEQQNITKAFSRKHSYNQQSLDSFETTNYRKLSYDSALMSYYENHGTPYDYYQYASVITPEQQLLKNPRKICEWAKDQNGSRTVQNIFDDHDVLNKDIVFNAIIKEPKTLIKDRFGNYVFQKVFQSGTTEHKQILLNTLWESMYELSLHPYGCRVIQKAIQFIAEKPQKQKQFIQQIIEHGLIMIQNQNGNHVVQKCLQIFAHDQIQPFVDIIISQLHELPYHAFGCRVVQKYLEQHRGQQKCQYILKQLLKQAVPLSQCQFGNYVMQHIVTKCEKQRQQVFTAFLSNIVELSVNKYASNVVEKAIQSGGANFCQILADWFIPNKQSLVMLSKHQFGNYVIQSMVERISKQKKQTIKAILKQNTAQISKSQFGRHVLMQLEKTKNK